MIYNCSGLPRCTEIKNLPANAGYSGDIGSIPGSGRSLREGNGNPLQYSCLENPMDKGAWLQSMLGAGAGAGAGAWSHTHWTTREVPILLI